ncbi:MAG: transposase, partial [Bacteroidota bacterium]
GSTRSPNGRKARDTFASLKKTCRKLGVSFWDFLYDRLTASNNIDDLPELLSRKLTFNY